MTMVQLPAGATQTRTQQVLDQVQNYYLKTRRPMLNLSLPLMALVLAAGPERRDCLYQPEALGSTTGGGK